MIENKEGKPYLSLWFGNFFEPAFNSKEFVKEGIHTIKDLGFNNVQLDSKSWQDFFDRYAGGEASDYVRMQEYMMECIKQEGLSHSFLAIYLNGDNLYPNIRFSPPVIGESTVRLNGRYGNYYKYWSDKAQQSMLDHLKGLYTLYGGNAARITVNGEEKSPVCTMWDPIAEMSFDQDGMNHYRNWLKNRYRDINAFNSAYQTGYASFDDIQPEYYWFNPSREAEPTKADYDNRTPLYYRFTDNLRYKNDVVVQYFATMQRKIKEQDAGLYLSPILSQWGMFLNINSENLLWDTSRRGIDPYRVAPFVDNCSFMSVPCTDEGDADAYASSCQNSMIRCMNPGREFSVGFYLGRYLYQDIYSVVTPCEIIGTAAASGASGHYAYGYCGLDDGGVMHKLGDPFQSSLRDGNNWAKEVLPRIKGARLKQAALLYPAEMALVEPYSIEGNPQRRRDLLGYYHSLCDAGIACDVIHPAQAADGALADYQVLVVPADSCYEAGIEPGLEEAIYAFAQRGGIVFCDVGHPLASRLFGLKMTPHEHQCVRYVEGIIPTGEVFASIEGGQAVAHYEDDGLTAIAALPVGKGMVYAFGFLYGTEYIAKKTGAVPTQYRNREYYPLCVVEHDPFKELLLQHVNAPLPAAKGIETACFDGCYVVVNHTSYPWDVSYLPQNRIFQQPCGGSILMPHSAVFASET